MKSKIVAVIVAGLSDCSLCSVADAGAPLFFAAEYDSAKPITLTGTVTNVEWMNPHARFYIDGEGDRKGRSEQIGSSSELR